MMPSPNINIYQLGADKYHINMRASGSELNSKESFSHISQAICSQRTFSVEETQHYNRENYVVVGSVLLPVPNYKMEGLVSCEGEYPSFYRFVSSLSDTAEDQGRAHVIIYNSANFMYYQHGAGHLKFIIEGIDLGELPIGHYFEFLIDPGVYKIYLAHKDLFWFEDTITIEVGEGIQVFDAHPTPAGNEILRSDKTMKEIKEKYRNYIKDPISEQKEQERAKNIREEKTTWETDGYE